MLLGACGASMVGSFTSVAAGKTLNKHHLDWARWSALMFTAFLLAANLWMLRALVTHDFSISYVAQVGSMHTPLWVTIASLWSSLEGSMLFWGGILGVYVAVFVWACSHSKDQRLFAYTLLVLFLFGICFTLLLIGPANPFEVVSPVPMDGPGPNPLLQDHVLMALHPPLLYVGYVGFAIPFGMAIALTLVGTTPMQWLSWMRLFLLFAWGILSIGIILGGFWAYEVLGWGGFWAWDPVENASLFPWLSGLAALHAYLVWKRQKGLLLWFLGLVMATFVLTLLGTFMTRSGVFNSVHSFSQSSIGPLLLALVGISMVGSFGLLAGRGHLFASIPKSIDVGSKAFFLLIHLLLVLFFLFVVLIGTIYPILTEAFWSTKVSVGEPYFNQMAIPTGFAFLVCLALGVGALWKHKDAITLFRRMKIPLFAGIICIVLSFVLGFDKALSLAALGVSGMALAACIQSVFWAIKNKHHATPTASWVERLWTHRRHIGAQFFHAGFIFLMIGIAGSKTYSAQQETFLAKGESLKIEGHTVSLKQISMQQENHRFSVVAHVDIARDQTRLGEVRPRLSFYPMKREPIAAPDIYSGLLDNVYVSILSATPVDGRVHLRVLVQRLFSWAWVSVPLILLGLLFCFKRKEHAHE